MWLIPDGWCLSSQDRLLYSKQTPPFSPMWIEEGVGSGVGVISLRKGDIHITSWLPMEVNGVRVGPVVDSDGEGAAAPKWETTLDRP